MKLTRGYKSILVTRERLGPRRFFLSIFSPFGLFLQHSFQGLTKMNVEQNYANKHAFRIRLYLKICLNEGMSSKTSSANVINKDEWRTLTNLSMSESMLGK